MKSLGWGLVVAGAALSLSFCEWLPQYQADKRMILSGVVAARSENRGWCGLWGLAIPGVMVGSGMGLVLREQRKLP